MVFKSESESGQVRELQGVFNQGAMRSSWQLAPLSVTLRVIYLCETEGHYRHEYRVKASRNPDMDLDAIKLEALEHARDKLPFPCPGEVSTRPKAQLRVAKLKSFKDRQP